MNEKPNEEQDALDKAFSFIKRNRDELKLKMHLAGKDAKDEWEKLEVKWREVEKRTQPLTGAVKEAASTTGDQAKKVTAAALDVAARELKDGYAKLRKLFE